REPRSLVRDQRISRKESEPPKRRERRESMASLNESDDGSEGGQQQNRSLKLHTPPKVSVQTILRVVLAAGLCPDRVSLIKSIYAIPISKKGREEENDQVSGEHNCCPDENYRFPTRPKRICEFGPGKASINDVIADRLVGPSIEFAPDPDAPACDRHCADRDECSFFCGEQQCHTCRSEQEIDGPAVIPCDQHSHHKKDKPGFDYK